MTPSLLLRVLDDIYSRVERLGVSPVVADGLAVSYWGHPRSTQDIDLADIKTLIALHERTLDYEYLRTKAHELRLPPDFWLPAE